MSLRYGELFAGYHGLGMGLQSVLGGSTAWFSEFDKAPSAILAHHWPDVPNHGDITKIDFTKVEPVDILTGGFPCQDVSHAGRRAGLIRDGEGRTRSGLWGEMLRAITELRPRLVVAENVRGLLSAAADSDVEPCPWCLGDANGEPDMRALGAVLADLADVGYDAWWVGLRAADVGGAHGRFRVFIFAVPADSHGAGRGGLGWLEPVGRDAHGRDSADGPRAAPEPETRGGLTLLPTPTTEPTTGNGHARNLGSEARLLPTPRTSDTNGAGAHGTGGPDLRTVVDLLPTPKARDHKDHRVEVAGHRPDDKDSLNRALAHLLPTPRATDGTKGGPNQRGSSGDLMLPSAVQLLPTPRTQNNENRQSEGYGGKDGNFHGLITGQPSWGDYAPAIARWERIIGRPAPDPTEPGPKGNPRLSARFVEWMMGLPTGHVTDVDIPRNAQLKALGNGVVPQQAAAAARWFLAQIERTAA